MRCPLCLNGTKVIDSRITLANQIRRRRSCKSCLYRFTTTEGISPSEDRTSPDLNTLEEIKEVLIAAVDSVTEALRSGTEESDTTTHTAADAES